MHRYETADMHRNSADAPRRSSVGAANRTQALAFVAPLYILTVPGEKHT